MKACMWNKSYWLDEDTVEPTEYDVMLFKSGFQVLDFIEHHFEPVGYTALWLLAESHLAIHSFPESNKVYVEMSSCNEDYFNRFDRFMGEKVR